jgi:hypothetical protein
MVELNHYQETDLAGAFASQQEAGELLKAMQAGQITGRDTTDLSLTQEPLKIESLEKTLRLLEFRMKDVKLWNAIPKLTAYNTVEEYIQLESYGTDRGGFYAEGELSDVEDSKYKRRAEQVKYIQVTGSVTLQAQVVRSYVDAMRKEVENKTMWIIRTVSNALTKADANKNDLQFNGIYAQHAKIGSNSGDVYATLDSWQDSPAVIDMRGASIRQQDVEDAAESVDASFGNVDTLFAPPTVLGGLFKDYFERQRIIMGATGYRGSIGTNPKAIDTQFGDVALMQDKFLKKTPARYATDGATSGKAPATPTSVSTALVSDGQSRFKTGEGWTGALGSVFYGVSASNQFGESSIRILGGDTNKVVLTDGQSVDLKWTPTAGAYAPDFYTVYRTKISTVTNAATSQVLFYPLFKVSVTELAAGYDNAAPTFVRDRNRFLPDTEDGFITEMAEEVLYFKQLMPISKLDLAITGPSNQFMTYLWGTPFLVTPKKLVRFINVGPYIPA